MYQVSSLCCTWQSALPCGHSGLHPYNSHSPLTHGVRIKIHESTCIGQSPRKHLAIDDKLVCFDLGINLVAQLMHGAQQRVAVRSSTAL